MKEMIRKRGVKGIIIAFTAAVLTFCTLFFAWIDVVDNSVMDRMFQKSSAQDMPVYIIAIDEKTLAELGQYTDWGRQYYAQLIDILCTDTGKPTVIGLDVLFTGNKDEAGDTALVNACKEAGNVVVGSTIIFQEKIAEEDGVKYLDHNDIERVVYPYDALRPYVSVGFTNNEEDSTDSYIRTMLTTLDIGGGATMDSFALTIYKKYAEEYGRTVTDFAHAKYNKYRFTYTGKPEQFQIVSMIDVLNGTRNPIEFEDGIVLVGAYATGFQDYFYVPVTHDQKMHGVEVHANIIEAIDEGKLQTDIKRLPLAIIYAVVVLVIAYLMSGLSLFTGGMLALGTLLIQLIACIILYKNGLYMRYITLPLFVVLLYAVLIINHYLTERRDKHKIANAFKKYVAPQVVDEVAKKGNYELKLGGEKKHIAVLFVDIRGFTPMSESLQPEQVVEILNEYLALTTNSIFKNGGTLDKFIGDATMAVFNSPFDLDDYVFRAVCTAWDIAAGSKHIESMFMERFGKTVSYGIGVNCGEAVIGNIGCDFRMDYTAIGDTVNTAARLESNAKAGQILISEAVYETVKDCVDVSPIGEIPLKGKSKGVFVYQVQKVYRDGEVKASDADCTPQNNETKSEET